MADQLHDTADRLYALAAECGWDARLSAASESTVSLYVELTRSARSIEDSDDDFEVYGPTGLEIMIVRLSDHGNVHRSEYELFDLRINGDLDRQFAVLAERLRREPHDVTCN